MRRLCQSPDLPEAKPKTPVVALFFARGIRPVRNQRLDLFCAIHLINFPRPRDEFEVMFVMTGRPAVIVPVLSKTMQSTLADRWQRQRLVSASLGGRAVVVSLRQSFLHLSLHHRSLHLGDRRALLSVLRVLVGCDVQFAELVWADFCNGARPDTDQDSRDGHRVSDPIGCKKMKFRICPGGTVDNSPAIHRWAGGK